MQWTGLINCAGSHPHFVMTSNPLKWNCNPCYCQGARSRPGQCVGAWRSAKLGESVWQDTQQGCCGGSYWSRKVNFFWQSGSNLTNLTTAWYHSISNPTKVVSQPDSIFGLPGRSRGKYSYNVKSVTMFSKLTLRSGHVEFCHHFSNWGCAWVILNLETVFLVQVSDHDTENLHFPGVGEEAARCGIFFCSSEFLFVKPHFLRQANNFF